MARSDNINKRHLQSCSTDQIFREFSVVQKLLTVFLFGRLAEWTFWTNPHAGIFCEWPPIRTAIRPKDAYCHDALTRFFRVHCPNLWVGAGNYNPIMFRRSNVTSLTRQNTTSLHTKNSRASNLCVSGGHFHKWGWQSRRRMVTCTQSR